MRPHFNSDPGSPFETDKDEYCASVVRKADPNLYFASLFAPGQHRNALFSLYAFNAEIARIRDIISDPMPGEVRLQWWRDAIMEEARGDVLAHPVASALLSTIDRYQLPRQAFLALLDARTFDLYNDPMPTLHDLEGYCGETCSTLIRLASIILANGTEPGGAEAAGHGGVSYALTGLLRAFPKHMARGQVYVPQDILKQNGVSVEDVLSRHNCAGLRVVKAHMVHIAREHLLKTRALRASISKAIIPAFLHLSLVEPYLDRLERSDDNACSNTKDIPQWRKQWILWRSARKARKSFPSPHT